MFSFSIVTNSTSPIFGVASRRWRQAQRHGDTDTEDNAGPKTTTSDRQTHQPTYQHWRLTQLRRRKLRLLKELPTWCWLQMWTNWWTKGLYGVCGGGLSNAWWWWYNAYRLWVTIEYRTDHLITEGKISPVDCPRWGQSPGSETNRRNNKHKFLYPESSRATC